MRRSKPCSPETSARCTASKAASSPRSVSHSTELGDLVAQHVQLGEQRLEAVAERRCGEDDGSGAGAGHGLGGPDSTGLRPAARGPPASRRTGASSALAWVRVLLLLLRLELLRAGAVA